MFKNSFAVAIKHNGQVLSENKESVFLPFGSEYSISLKNLNSLTAFVKIFIDGKEVTPLRGIEMDPKQSFDINRFYDKNNSFKFIELTEEIKKQRGSDLEDSLVRVEVRFDEAESLFDKMNRLEKTTIGPSIGRDISFPEPYIVDGGPGSLFPPGGLVPQPSICDSIRYQAKDFTGDMTTAATATFASNGDNARGITVSGSPAQEAYPGKESYSKQMRSLSSETIFNFLLTGFQDNQVIDTAVTNKSKKICPTCGKKYKYKYNYCPMDGTYLSKEG